MVTPTIIALIPFIVNEQELKAAPSTSIISPILPALGNTAVIVGTSSTWKKSNPKAEPALVVTVKKPDVAPTGKRTSIWLALLLTIVTATPFSVTEVGEARFEPVIVIVEPTKPLSGKTELIVGNTVTVNGAKEFPLPPGLVTVITPVVAAAGTLATIELSSITVNKAFTPLKETDVALVKPVPNMVIDSPTPPEIGLKLVTTGAGITTVKLDELLAVPTEVTTEIGPVVAVVGTVALI